MRYVVAFVLALALVASPLGAGAQAVEEGGLRLERWHPEAFVDPAEPVASPQPQDPALRLEVDSTGLEIAPAAQTLEDLERRAKRARAGLIASAISVGVGGALFAGSVLYVAKSDNDSASFDLNLGPNIAMGTFGAIFSFGGVIGLGLSGKTLRTAKRQLKLHAAGVATLAPSPPWKADVYTFEELKLRKRRAAFGLIVPSAMTVAGVVPLVLGMKGQCTDDFGIVDNDSCRRLRTAGLVLTISGVLGLFVGTGVVVHRARAVRRRAEEVHYWTPRRVQWDVERSLLVF
jgi:hypothetical protein